MKLTPNLLPEEDARPQKGPRFPRKNPFARTRAVEAEEEAEEGEEEAYEEEEEEDEEYEDEPAPKRGVLRRVLVTLLVCVLGFAIFFFGIRGVVSEMSVGQASSETEVQQDPSDADDVDVHDGNETHVEEPITEEPITEEPITEAPLSVEDQLAQVSEEVTRLQGELDRTNELLAASQAREAQLQAQLGASASTTK